jgi:hypothetical protein
LVNCVIINTELLISGERDDIVLKPFLPWNAEE